MALRKSIKQWGIGVLIPVLVLLPQLLLATHSMLEFSDQGQQEHQFAVALLSVSDHDHEHDDFSHDALQALYHGHDVADHIQETVHDLDVSRWSSPLPQTWRGAYHYSLKPIYPSPPKRPPRALDKR